MIQHSHPRPRIAETPSCVSAAVPASAADDDDAEDPRSLCAEQVDSVWTGMLYIPVAQEHVCTVPSARQDAGH